MLKISRYVLLSAAGIWLLVSVAALWGEYSLWWNRERVLYAGRPPAEQWKDVLKRAGVDRLLPGRVAAQTKGWPERVSYRLDGKPNESSLAKYWLIPLIPNAETSAYRLSLNDPIPEEGFSTALFSTPPSPSGFLAACLLVLGAAVWLRFSGLLTHPESLCLSMMLLGLLTLLSRACFGSAIGGMLIFALVGGAGLLRVLGQGFRQRHSLWRFFIGLKAGFRWLGLALLVLLLAPIFWSFLMSVVVVPDDWDAWAIWGAKAKVLALGVGSLSDVTFFGHADYPLLWPSIWSFTGWCSGGWEEQWVKGWGPLFLLLLCVELWMLNGRDPGASRASLFRSGLRPLLLVSMPAVPLIASWGYAEPLLWLMMVCAAGVLIRYQRSGDRRLLLALGCLAAGAAHTKNEGVLFLVLLGASVLLFPPDTETGRASTWQTKFLKAGKRLMVFSVPVLLLYGPWAWWIRARMALGSDATVGLLSLNERASIAWTRLPSGLHHMGRIWMDVRQWNLVLIPLMVAGAYVMFFSSSSRRRALCIPFGMLLAYVMIILFHTAELHWQIGTSWNRLTIHVAVLILACFPPLLAVVRKGRRSEL